MTSSAVGGERQSGASGPSTCSGPSGARQCLYAIAVEFGPRLDAEAGAVFAKAARRPLHRHPPLEPRQRNHPIAAAKSTQGSIHAVDALASYEASCAKSHPLVPGR